jgi:TonB-linked SusC/RagA family outer membrane protein
MKKLLQSLFILLFVAGSAMAQNRTITGTVTGKDDGKPLPGVSVKIKGAKGATQTDADGTYSISVPTAATTLEFTYLGYVSQGKAISGSVVNATLDADAKTLNDVVVVGYQSVKRSDLVGNVATISNKEVANKPAISLTQSLQGAATGVQVTGTSGRPGANAYIKIRGVGSINASSEPLIIMDGLQISSVAYNSINPNDVEEINVLKDAAASAIYGSRAANGVIVIRTKLGKPGDPTIRYSFQYGKSEVQDLKNVSLMTSAQKLQYEYELGYTNPLITAAISPANGFPANSTVTSISADQRQTIWNSLISTGAGDWKDYLLQKGTNKTHEISLSGADDKFRYYFSLNKADNEGTEINSYFNRKGGRLNVEYQAKDWFKIGTNIGITNTFERQVRETFNTQNLYASLFLYNPYEAVKLADGTYNTTMQGFSSIEGSLNNPVFYNRVNSYATLFGEAKFFKHLTLRTQVGATYNTLKYESYLKPGSNLATLLGYNQKNDQGNQDFFYTFTNTAAWNQTFGGKHNVNFLAGTEFSKDALYSYSLTGRNFPTASVETLENASTPTLASTSRSEFALESYFGSANYNFDRRYYLTFSARRDGSSRFGSNNRFANFYAGGISWNIKNEKFFKADWVDALSLKASAGTTGNNNIGNYDALGTYALNVKYNDLPAAAPSRLPNPNLTWETSMQYDGSVTFGLLNNRLVGDLGYYRKETSDLLYDVNVSTTTGFSTYKGNIGSMRNSGIEASLTGTLIRNKDINWTVSGSYSSVNNKVTELYSDNVPNGYGRFVVGETLNTYYLVKWAGINPANGKNQFYNIDGSVTEEYSSGQAQLLKGKSPIAKFFGTIGTDFRYKDFDFSARLYYTGGNYILNVMDQVGASDGENVNNNQYTEAFDYWKKPGDVVRYANPLDPTQNVTYDTDKYLEKGDYISLRDVTIGYNVPVKFTKYIKSKGIRLFVQGTNLAMLTKFRGIPEVGESNRERSDFAGTFNLYGYPPLKSYTFGVDVRF